MDEKLRICRLSVARRSANSLSMNLRHAAALALVGWYLMIPPHPTDTTLDSDAPLSKRRVYDAFDTAATCDTARASEEQDWKSKADADPDNALAKFLVKSLLTSQCIATDDPRLKEK